MTDIVERLRTPGNWNDELHREAADEIERLRTVLEKIATLRYSNNSAASVAQSALDTMRVLEKPAAEVGKHPWTMTIEAELATIERCAQVADAIEQNKYGEGIIAARIRALKDKK